MEKDHREEGQTICVCERRYGSVWDDSFCCSEGAQRCIFRINDDKCEMIGLENGEFNDK